MSRYRISTIKVLCAILVGFWLCEEGNADVSAAMSANSTNTTNLTTTTIIWILSNTTRTATTTADPAPTSVNETTATTNFTPTSVNETTATTSPEPTPDDNSTAVLMTSTTAGPSPASTTGNTTDNATTATTLITTTGTATKTATATVTQAPITDIDIQKGSIVTLISDESAFKLALKAAAGWRWDDSMRSILGSEQTVMESASGGFFGLEALIENGQPVWYYPISVVVSVKVLTNVARNKPVTTNLANTFSRDVQLITDGATATGEWSSRSATGIFSIDLQGTYLIKTVKLYWSGAWGRDTNSFRVVLRSSDIETVAYATNSAQAQENRIDILDLVSLGTEGIADTIILECLQRRSLGYAIYEIEVLGFQAGNNQSASTTITPTTTTAAVAWYATTYDRDAELTNCVSPDTIKFTLPPTHPMGSGTALCGALGMSCVGVIDWQCRQLNCTDGAGGSRAASCAPRQAFSYTCIPGQTQSEGPYMFATSDNSKGACARKCSVTSGCKAFDYTSNTANNACRGVTSGQTPRLQPGEDARQYCYEVDVGSDGNEAAITPVAQGSGCPSPTSPYSTFTCCCGTDCCWDNCRHSTPPITDCLVGQASGATWIWSGKWYMAIQAPNPYTLRSSWTAGYASNCLSLGCSTMADGSANSLAQCLSTCDSTSLCNVINFVPTGADASSGEGRCCMRICLSPDLKLVTKWKGWNVYTKQAVPRVVAVGKKCSNVPTQLPPFGHCNKIGGDLGTGRFSTLSLCAACVAADPACDKGIFSYQTLAQNYCKCLPVNDVCTARSTDDNYNIYETRTQVINIAWNAGFGDESARQKTVAAGDKLIFTWSGTHNVYKMPDKAAFDACDFENATNLGDTSPVVYTLENATEYFACQISTHCSAGQKLAAKQLTTSLLSWSYADATVLTVADTTGFEVGYNIIIRSSAGTETNVVIGFSSLILKYPLQFSHPPGTTVSLMDSDDPWYETLILTTTTPSKTLPSTTTMPSPAPITTTSSSDPAEEPPRCFPSAGKLVCCNATHHMMPDGMLMPNARHNPNPCAVCDRYPCTLADPNEGTKNNTPMGLAANGAARAMLSCVSLLCCSLAAHAFLSIL